VIASSDRVERERRSTWRWPRWQGQMTAHESTTGSVAAAYVHAVRRGSRSLLLARLPILTSVLLVCLGCSTTARPTVLVVVETNCSFGEASQALVTLHCDNAATVEKPLNYYGRAKFRLPPHVKSCRVSFNWEDFESESAFVIGARRTHIVHFQPLRECTWIAVRPQGFVPETQTWYFHAPDR
jgi:hypothetical protein